MLGPSNVRDFSGFVVDTAIANYVPPESIVTDWVFFNPLIYVLYAIDLRRNVDFRYFGSGSPFEYDMSGSSTPASASCRSRPLTAGPGMPEEPSPYSGPLDLGDPALPSSTMPHQAPAGRLLP